MVQSSASLLCATSLPHHNGHYFRLFLGNHVRVEAIVNDTVGCLCTGAYEDDEAQIGVIYGTGTNACYVEKLENIKTLSLDPKDSDQVHVLKL